MLKRRCDHRSCDYDLSNGKLSPKNVIGASTGFERMASALALQCSTNWAMKTYMFGAGQFIETFEYYVNCEHTNEMKMWSSQLWLRFKQSLKFNKLACSQHMGLHSSVGKKALTQRPWVRIPLKPRKHFSGLIYDCLNRNHNCDDHIFISFVCPQFTQYS